jgi:spore coat protein A
MKRRDLFKIASLGGLSFLVDKKLGWAFDLSPTGLPKFVQALPLLGPSGIPVASPDKSNPAFDYYKILLTDYQHQFHPNLPASHVRGYADITNGITPNSRYLGGVIVANKNQPVKVTFKNALSPTHPLPVDRSIPDADTGADSRASTHLHGGFVGWESDGGPAAWFDPNGNTGMSFSNPGANPDEADHWYPNQQTSRLMWYHDHAMGITRLNAYAGLASAYIVRDPVELNLVNQGYIPALEIPLIIQDKIFVDGTDSGYTWGVRGDLWYPYVYDKNPWPTGRWDYGPDLSPPGPEFPLAMPVPTQVPELFGDTIVVNGAAWPYLTVQQRHYRFRILNGSQARTYNLQLFYSQGSKATEANLKAGGPRIIQIGNEGGFLPEPVALNKPPVGISFDTNPMNPTYGNVIAYNLLLGPAERADVIIDFSACPVGSRLILYNDAPAPFPGADMRNDYYTGAPDLSLEGGAKTPLSGKGPNTRTLLQFRVMARKGLADPANMKKMEARAVNKTGFNPLAGANPELPYTPADAVRTRNLTLNEDFDDYGRLVQMLGTDVSLRKNNQGLLSFSRRYNDKETEFPSAGDIELWNIINLTIDTHPIHIHLANAKLISRQMFWVLTYKGGNPFLMDVPRPPDPNERGWKETMRCNPGEVTTFLVKWDLPTLPYVPPTSPRFPGKHEYVWHCHILEHEEHDMMRPLILSP